MFNYITLIIQLLPKIIELIKALEILFPGKGKGPVKLDILKTVVSDSCHDSGMVMGTVVKVAEKAVKQFNNDGTFTTWDPESPRPENPVI